MSAYILEYAGQPASIRPSGRVDLVSSDHSATHFSSEADAWLAAHHARLNPRLCRVVNLRSGGLASAAISTISGLLHNPPANCGGGNAARQDAVPAVNIASDLSGATRPGKIRNGGLSL